tara:strand:+ start:56372 stop:56719 length:348 start_codon:yes stop_codon:yes gene_type:complete
MIIEYDSNEINKVLIEYNRESVKTFEQSKILFASLYQEIEIKLNVEDIKLENDNILVEGLWISFNEDHYLLRLYFYNSIEDKINFEQKEIKFKITEKDFDEIENFFLMEERCLIG